jgi:exodeoxyribonuclease VII small subunit
MAEAPKFEEGLAGLEKLVDELENGELGLDEAMRRFEKGVKLSAQLQAALETAQRKVEKLAQGSDGEAVLEPFDDDEAEDEAPAAPKKAKAKKAGQDTLF